jgi:hypothetical protein
VKKRVAALVTAVLAIAVAVIAYVMLSEPGEAPQSAEPKAFKCVRTVSVYAALIENPTAARALLVGGFKDFYREILEHAGLVCETSPEGEFDVVFVAGAASRRELSAARKALAPDGVWAECIDAREMKASSFKKRLEALPDECVHVWMPGEKDWVLVGRRSSARPRLEDMMDLFAREGGVCRPRRGAVQHSAGRVRQLRGDARRHGRGVCGGGRPGRAGEFRDA